MAGRTCQTSDTGDRTTGLALTDGGIPERKGVELRVHGVGGDPPRAVLGMPFPEDAVECWATAGDRKAVFHRRDQPEVRVFSWGDLTSRSRWFAAWTLLLPFTLVNVAGWAGRGPTVAIRALAFLCGLIVTVLTVGWLALAGVLLVGEAWLGWGLALAVVGTALLGACSMWVTERYGRHRPPWWTDESAGHGVLDPPKLSHPRFFDNRRVHLRGRVVHVVAVALAWGAIAVAYWGRQDDFQGNLERGIAWATSAGLLVVALLALVSFESTVSSSRWRWSAPAMAAGGALFLTGGVPSALLVARNGGWEGFRGRQAFVFFDLYGATLAVGVMAAMVVGAVVLSRGSPAEREDASAPAADPGRQPLLCSSGARQAARRAQIVRHVDLVTTAMLVTFLVGGAIVFADRVLPGEGPPSWRQAPGNVLFVLGLWALAVVVWFVLRDLWRNSRSLEHRRKIGQLWDVLTFWPRTVHPLAVRSYAERAVPELQHYLSRHGPGPPPHRWTVTAHSQGSVLAYAALNGLPSTERSAAPVDLLTFGSPLRTLYAKAFPRYFDVGDFRALRDDLRGAGSPEGQGSWRNVFRATDGVGRGVFGDDLESPDPGSEMAITDPNQLPPVRDPCAPDAEQDPPVEERNPTIWGHNGYRRSRPFKTLVYRSRFGRDDCGA